MKLIVCDLCRLVVPLGYRIKHCRCGNIKGKYLKGDPEGRRIVIYVKDMGTSRILGLDNRVRFNFKKRGKCWIIDFDDWTVKKLVVLQ